MLTLRLVQTIKLQKGVQGRVCKHTKWEMNYLMRLRWIIYWQSSIPTKPMYFHAFLLLIRLIHRTSRSTSRCDGVQFEGYIINLHNKTIIHVDSLYCKARNFVSLRIAEILYPEEAGASFWSLFKSRKQFDSNSRGYGLLYDFIHSADCRRSKQGKRF